VVTAHQPPAQPSRGTEPFDLGHAVLTGLPPTNPQLDDVKLKSAKRASQR
jgi:hypothetical protein